MKNTAFPLRSTFILAAIITMTGCSTTVIKTPSSPVTGYMPVKKIDLHVGLQLDDEFRKAKWASQGFEIPLGENLSRNAETMTRNLFTKVSVISNSTSRLPNSVGAILIPKVAGVEQASGMWAWTDASATLLLEWTLKDASGQTVWAETIKGEGTGKLGTAFSQISNAEARNAAMIEDAFKKSHQAISASADIRKLGAKP